MGPKLSYIEPTFEETREGRTAQTISWPQGRGEGAALEGRRSSLARSRSVALLPTPWAPRPGGSLPSRCHVYHLEEQDTTPDLQLLARVGGLSSPRPPLYYFGDSQGWLAARSRETIEASLVFEEEEEQEMVEHLPPSQRDLPSLPTTFPPSHPREEEAGEEDSLGEGLMTREEIIGVYCNLKEVRQGQDVSQETLHSS